MVERRSSWKIRMKQAIPSKMRSKRRGLRKRVNLEFHQIKRRKKSRNQMRRWINLRIRSCQRKLKMSEEVEPIN